MSEETVTKKSVLTRAMEAAEAKKAAKAENTEPENAGFAADKKQFIKRALVAGAITAVVTVVAVKLLPKAANEEETSEETPTQD
ncbi:hypothetical protein SEA_ROSAASANTEWAA_29 [Streptomyces phage RosaAsantewaa]|nr:hypothetical protein SEA_ROSAASANTEWAA_29 [Streptomyces phage RosaAsantewaa]